MLDAYGGWVESRPVNGVWSGGGAARALLLLGLVVSGIAAAGPVELQRGTATFSQGALGGGPYSPGMAIDGLFDANGWTINHFPNNDPSQEFTADEIAVWQTVGDVGPGVLTFTMYFLHWNPGHVLGRFRLSVTTDDRSTYADGLRENGDVTANWTVLTNPVVVYAPSGMTFTRLADHSLLAGGAVPGQAVYAVSSPVNLFGITGIRLEVLKDPSLPRSGPGFAANGNFVLTEMQLTAASIARTVGINIKPAGAQNTINLGSTGVVRVALLADPTLNSGDVDVNTVRFAGAPPEKSVYDDVNSDGLIDLLFAFRIQDLQLTPSSTEATLTGYLRDGTPIVGSDSVRIAQGK